MIMPPCASLLLLQLYSIDSHIITLSVLSAGGQSYSLIQSEENTVSCCSSDISIAV